LKASERKPAHAVVIGGSIVGSTVAALLAQRFERVTILERDSVPGTAQFRGGVPQSRHVHALLARGASELEGLFPGFLAEMAASGAQHIDVGRDVAWLTPGGWGVTFESRISMCCATRDLIEYQVRRRAVSSPAVTLIDSTAVTGLQTDSSRSRVTGVRLRNRGSADREREMQADLVVDTAGRGSQLPDWLTAIGRPRVRESVVDAKMAYASRFYAVPAGALCGWRAVYVQAALPHSPRGGILFPVEGNRHHLTLFGYAGAAPPTDESGFVEFTRSLRSPVLADVLRSATALTPIIGHRRTENRWRRFDEIADWPDGLVAVGDSVCCFDPVYGQGMTTGILGAFTLVSHLDAASNRRREPSRLAQKVQKQMAGVVRPAWNLATGEDLRLASTTGGRLRLRDRLLQRYVDRVIATATADPAVRRQLLSVMNMLSKPQALLQPSVFARVASYVCGAKQTPEPLWPAAPVAPGPLASRSRADRIAPMADSTIVAAGRSR
jgi:2-polyprenyl-6-methoxyphenol hydroxylase-like FAD-dependent oxidoreductase